MGKMTTADISLFLKYNDLKHEEMQTSQAKQNSLAPKVSSDSGRNSGDSAKLLPEPTAVLCQWFAFQVGLTACRRHTQAGTACPCRERSATGGRAACHLQPGPCATLRFLSLWAAGNPVFSWTLYRAHSISFPHILKLWQNVHDVRVTI